MKTPPDPTAVEADMRSRMPQRLFEHCVEVATLARRLAGLHKVDPEWMYLAGLYHDLAKTMELEEMNAVAASGGMVFDQEESRSRSLLHSAASASLFQKECLAPEAFVRAVRGHTAGGAPFGTEEQILYVADFAAPGREYSQGESIRRTAEKDIVAATLQAVTLKMQFLMEKNKPVHPKSVMLFKLLSPHAPPVRDGS